MPCTRNVVTPARFTQIRFIRNNDNAPMANAGCPPPRSSPNVTSGGNNATAIITPISVAEMNASAPGEPDANATTISPIGGLALILIAAASAWPTLHYGQQGL